MKIKNIQSINEFVIKFANVNGTGSASANHMFAKAVFRMGIPVAPKNIFPSNIQGLPTWYEVRVSEKSYLGRRGGIDIMVSVNPQSMADDVKEVNPGGYFFYDNTKQIDLRFVRNDVSYVGVPLTKMCLHEYQDPKQRQLFKNIIYVGALAALLDMDFAILKDLVADQFKGKQKLIAPNIHALELGYQYIQNNYDCPLDIRLRKANSVGDNILIDGNSAIALGAIYAGATIAAWYPITPSTSVVEAFNKYANRLRIDPGTGRKNFAVIQAEDELAAIGMVIGAYWNGARAFTATSGPGISLMSEFLGLAYFAEVPTVLIDVQRTGPSTGMPTRTQQSDILASAYASHGDTKHVLLFPSTPKECFDLSAQAFDLAERLQTPVIMLTDLDLGMNDHVSEPFNWAADRKYDRGKVLDEEQLEKLEKYGRYRDVDDDGICYRTYPGTHPTKGAFFTRGTSRDEYAIYTEKGEIYVENMERLLKKWETAKSLVPAPEFYQQENQQEYGILFFGTSSASALEAKDYLEEQGIPLDAMRVKAFPFNTEVKGFLSAHNKVFVIEQNRDGQLRTLLINEFDFDPTRLISILDYEGMGITAKCIREKVSSILGSGNVRPMKRSAGESSQ